MTKASLPGVASINKDTEVQFSTFSYDIMGDFYFDHYPKLINGSIPIGTGKFIDDLGEVGVGGLRHIDMVSLEILID